MAKIPVHEEAFKSYYEMGETRSLKRLTDEHGYKEGTVNKWSSKFEWKERVKQLEEEEYHKRAIKIAKKVKNKKLDYSEQLQKVLDEWFKMTLVSGKILDMDAKELKVLMELYLLLGTNEQQSISVNSTTTIKMDEQTAELVGNLQLNINKMFAENNEDED